MSQRAAHYEESLSREIRRCEGIYYTPREVVVEMLSTLYTLRDVDICDPCCGAGNFLVEAVMMGAQVERIYGFDSDREAVMIARERIFEISGFDASQNIRVADFWDIAPKLGERFDVIVTNPPWGSRISSTRRAELVERYEIGHSSDSASLMMMAALSTLRKGGEICSLLPDAFFNIGGFEDVRRRLLKLSISHLYDYGHPFHGLMTRAESITLRKRESSGEEQVSCRWEGQCHRRSQRSFTTNPKAIINMWLSSEGAEAVEMIYSHSHITLHNNATWGMGIVSGDNAHFCHESPSVGDVEVARGYNITEEGLTPLTTYMPSDMSLYQQVAPLEFYLAPEKIVYRFIANRPLCCCDREQHYILNSANGFILDDRFALSADEVVRRLNSKVIVWLFRAIFRTNKVLRYDLEQLPLHLKFDPSDLGIEPTEEGGYRVIKKIDN